MIMRALVHPKWANDQQHTRIVHFYLLLHWSIIQYYFTAVLLSYSCTSQECTSRTPKSLSEPSTVPEFCTSLSFVPLIHNTRLLHNSTTRYYQCELKSTSWTLKHIEQTHTHTLKRPDNNNQHTQNMVATVQRIAITKITPLQPLPLNFK